MTPAVIHSSSSDRPVTVLEIDPPIEEDEVDLDLDDLEEFEEPAINRATTKRLRKSELDLMASLSMVVLEEN